MTSSNEKREQTKHREIGMISFLFLSLCLAVLPACERQDKEVTAAPPKDPPILVIGIDGLEWDVMLPLIRQGRLPEMTKLMERGVYGHLQTLKPTLSPAIWTTVATGKMPTEHGITHFVKMGGGRKGMQLFSNMDRKTKAFWNIASDYDKKVGVIGWWMTFPVEPINGVMVAQTNTSEQLDTRYGQAVWKGQLIKGVPGQVHPPEQQGRLMSLLTGVDDSLEKKTEAIFGQFQHPLSELGKRLWENCMWSFRADVSYLTIAKTLLSDDDQYDVLAVYFGGPDVVGHRFWRYAYPDKYKDTPTAEQIANFGKLIDDYYVYMDSVVGQLVALSPPGTRILIMSDHGMQAINQARTFNPDAPPADVNSAHHKNAEPGIIIAAGRDIAIEDDPKPPAKIEETDLIAPYTVLDITPTILALLEIPVGEDMPGRPTLVDPGFLAEHPFKKVQSHDTQEWIRAHTNGNSELPGQDERLEQLRALGYIN